MVDTDLWKAFFSQPSNPAIDRRREEFERLLTHLRVFLELDLIRLCITTQGLLELCSHFEDEDAESAILALSRMLEVITVTEEHRQQAQGLSWEDKDSAIEYAVARSEGIPIILALEPQYFAAAQPPTRVYSPGAILTMRRISEWLPVLDPVFRRRLYRHLAVVPASKSQEDYLELIKSWIENSQPRVVCAASVQVLMEVYHNQGFADGLARHVDLVTPAGQPLVWILRLMGARTQERMTDSDLFEAVCEYCNSTRQKVFIVGSKPKVLNHIGHNFQERFPDIELVGLKYMALSSSPDSDTADEELIQEINQSNATVVFISLPSPFRETWLAHNHRKIKSVLIGVGTAFPISLGTLKRAPKILQIIGLEWAFLLSQNPTEFLKSYLICIPEFLLLALRKQIFQLNHQHCLVALPRHPRVVDLLYHICEPHTTSMNNPEVGSC